MSPETERPRCPDCWPGYDSDSHDHIFHACPHAFEPTDNARCAMDRPCRPRSHWPQDCPWWPVDPGQLLTGDVVRGVIGNRIGWSLTAHLVVEPLGQPGTFGPTYVVVPVLGLDAPQVNRPELATYSARAQVVACRPAQHSAAHIVAIRWAGEQDMSQVIADFEAACRAERADVDLSTFVRIHEPTPGAARILTCRQCNYDDHRCPGCGIDVSHGTVACAGCNGDLDAIQAMIAIAGREMVAVASVPSALVDSRPGCPDCVDDASDFYETPESSAVCPHLVGTATRCAPSQPCRARQHLRQDCPWWPVPVGQLEAGDVVREIVGLGGHPDHMLLVAVVREPGAYVMVPVLDPYHPVPQGEPEPYRPPDGGLVVTAARTRTDSVAAVITSVEHYWRAGQDQAAAYIPPSGRCPECTAPGEDPRSWCDCRDDERCRSDRVCRQRAHDPVHCPWWPTSWGQVDVGDHVRTIQGLMYRVGSAVRYDGIGSYSLIPVSDWRPAADGASWVPFGGKLLGLDGMRDDAPVIAAKSLEFPGGELDPKDLPPLTLAAVQALVTGGVALSPVTDVPVTVSGA